jgi:hypothetical protein
LEVYDFSFSPSIDAALVTVTPDLSGMGLSFSSSSLLPPNYVVTYGVASTAFFRVGMSLIPPTGVPPGTINVGELVCLGALFTAGPTCPGSTTTLNLFDGNSGSLLVSSTSISPQAFLGIQDTITTDSTYSLGGIENTFSYTPTPEPGTVLLFAIGLLGMLSRRPGLFRRC